MNTLSLVVLIGRDKKNFDRVYNSLKLLKHQPDEIIFVYDSKFVRETLASDRHEGEDYKNIFFIGDKKQPQMRNLALQVSSCDWVWFIDDDVEVHSDACTNLRSAIENISDLDNVGCLAGRIVEPIDAAARSYLLRVGRPTSISYLRALVGYFDWGGEDPRFMNIPYLSTKGGGSYPVVEFAQGTNMAFPRRALLRIGGFEEMLGYGYSSFEDSEPSFALKSLKLNTLYLDNVSVTHFKEPRVGGYHRSFDQKFGMYFIRNYAITLIRNKYPTMFLSIVYVFVFATFNPFRTAKYYYKSFGFLSGLRNFLLSYFFSFWGLFKAIRLFAISPSRQSYLNKNVNT